MEHRRVQTSSLPKTLWSLTLVLCLGASACDEDLSWPGAPAETKEKPCEGASPDPQPGSIPGLDEPKPKEEPDPSGPKHPGEPDPAPESAKPQEPEDSSSAPQEPDPTESSSPDSTLPDEPTPTEALGVEIWEFLPDPKRSDGLADSPESVDLIVTGKQGQEGPVSFELSGQGWSLLSQDSFPDTPKLWMRTGSLIRIERYKNQAQLDLAKAKFPTQVLDPKTGVLAVQILRMTGAGLRNKGGWLALRSGPNAGLHGVIYGEIETEKIDSEVLANWKGPFATKAPSGQALCKIPDEPKDGDTDAAWWTACEPSVWGRPAKRAK